MVAAPQKKLPESGKKTRIVEPLVLPTTYLEIWSDKIRVLETRIFVAGFRARRWQNSGPVDSGFA